MPLAWNRAGSVPAFPSGPGRAARRAHPAAQARPGLPGRAGTGTKPDGPCRAWAGPKNRASCRAVGLRAACSSMPAPHQRLEGTADPRKTSRCSSWIKEAWRGRMRPRWVRLEPAATVAKSPILMLRGAKIASAVVRVKHRVAGCCPLSLSSRHPFPRR